MPVDNDAHPIDPDAKPPAQLAQRLGVDVVPELLELALTHSSFAFENGGVANNERLEFLGDAVLGLAVTSLLYRSYPDETEGQLAKRRPGLVSTVALAEIARDLGLGDFIRLGRGERRTRGYDKDSILADTLEAVIGATYLSNGPEVARDLVLRLVEPLRLRADATGAPVDHKTALQELAAELGGTAPVYEVTGSGPEHDRRFRATVTVRRADAGTSKRQAGAEAQPGASGAVLVTATGEGTSKKQAEIAAALVAWTELSGRA